MHDPHASCWGVPTSWYCTHLLSALDGLLHTKIVCGDRGWASNALQCQKKKQIHQHVRWYFGFLYVPNQRFPLPTWSTCTTANHTLHNGIHKMSHGKNTFANFISARGQFRSPLSHSHFRFRFVPLNTPSKKSVEFACVHEHVACWSARWCLPPAERRLATLLHLHCPLNRSRLNLRLCLRNAPQCDLVRAPIPNFRAQMGVFPSKWRASRSRRTTRRTPTAC